MRIRQQAYTRYGVPLVWWIDPLKRIATVHRPGQTVEEVDDSGTLDGGEILPGFRLPLAEIFEA